MKTRSLIHYSLKQNIQEGTDQILWETTLKKNQSGMICLKQTIPLQFF